MSVSTRQRLHAIVSGRVQGVSFRYYTTQKAQQLNLTGWVRNNPDGTVEVVAEGDRADLDKLLEFLHTGSPAARVQHVDSTRETGQESFKSFSVRY